MQIISEAQILQISAQHALCFHGQEDSFLEGVMGNTFWLRAGWWGSVLVLCPAVVSKPWLVGAGSTDRPRAAPVEPELGTLPAVPAGAQRSQSSLTTSNFFSLPEFQELYWNTKPRCQRHLGSAVFHHETLRHENFLPCDSSGCLMPARSACCALALLEELPGWPWSHLGASPHRAVRVYF